MSPVRSLQWVSYMSVAVMCFGVGVMIGPRIRPQEPLQDAGTEETKRLPTRNLVEARSRNPTLEQLEALGYVDATYDSRSELAGVIRNNEGRTNPGLNLYTSQAGAILVDMEGREVHRWKADQEERWQHAELLPNGDVLVVVPDRRLSRYDKNSREIWSVQGRFHHDLWVHGDEIFALAREGRLVEQVHPQCETLVDLIRVLSLDGTVKRDISVLEAIHDSPYRFLLPSVRHRSAERLPGQLDIVHANHVEVFDGRLADANPLFARGNILLSARNINAIFILDGRTLEIVWIWGPSNLTFQHQPTLLENGNILVFDNGLTRSRVLEIEPRSGTIVWAYAPLQGFFSEFRGGHQRLPNANTLITESDTGYVREVTRSRRVVWEFANPVVNSKQEREVIWRMTRIDPQMLEFLSK